MRGVKNFRTPYFLDKSVDGRENITITGNSISLHYGCPTTTDCSPYVVDLPRGRFLLEVWGARGCMGGAGGYSRGIITVNTINEANKYSRFYVYVGSSGLINDGNGGFNGGGALGGSMWLTNSNMRRYVGGGATDIRTIEGVATKLNSVDFYTTYFGPKTSLDSRIIVAGGGGGNNPSNGYGGGESGSSSSAASSGNQGSGGHTGGLSGVDGGFGYGGYTIRSDQGISGGGVGYYGGGGHTLSFGGSGYVNKNILKDAKTISGNDVFPSPYKQKNNQINDCCARITFLDQPLFYTLSNNKPNIVFAFLVLFISS